MRRLYNSTVSQYYDYETIMVQYDSPGIAQVFHGNKSAMHTHTGTLMICYGCVGEVG